MAMKIAKLITLAAWLLCLSSCGSGYYLKKAQKAIEKAQEKGATWSRDTIYQQVETVRPEIRVDTLVKWADAVRDTITVTKEKVTTKVLIKPGQPVYVHTIVKPDTVVKKVPVYITNTINVKKAHPTWADLFLALSIAVVVTWLVGYIRR